MNLELSLHHSASLSQQLNLAPQLLNWLKLLQCPTTELSSMIQREMESNPSLEADSMKAKDRETLDATPSERTEREPDLSSNDDYDLDAKFSYLSQIDEDWNDEYGQKRGADHSSSSELIEKQQFIIDSIVTSGSIYDYLSKQINSLNLSEEDLRLVELVIGSIDERGYLSISLTELAEMADTTLARMEGILHQVHTLDPIGIGARDLSECLLLQLDPTNGAHELAIGIIKEHLTELGERQYPAIAEALHVTETEIYEAHQLIKKLNPCPAATICPKPIEYVTPDVTIREINGEYVIELNDEYIPRLRISASCRRLMRSKDLTPEDRSYLRRKIRTATFLIQGISQRQDTLKNVTQEIIRVQKEFFSSKEGELRPLTMAKVASIINVHETTVSRALANKYIQTPRGVFEMKYFFRSGYQCSDGTAMTPESVKNIVRKLIETEDPTTPLTDLQVVNLLKARGLKLARRTIAKYRDELDIPASKERKKSSLPRQPSVALSCSKTTATAFDPSRSETKSLPEDALALQAS